MDRLRDKIKKILNKDVTNLLNKYKILLVSIAIVVVLSCIGLIVSYAFYQVTNTTPVILTTTPQIPDLEVKIMAEDRDTNGNGVGSYSTYSYIPRAGYKYVENMSYCTNGGTITYDATNYNASIDATNHDVCYLYFKSTESLDITLEVYAENTDSDGNGTGSYTKLETTTLPSIGYEFNSTESTCTYADGRTLTDTNTPTVTYDVAEQNFTVKAPEKGAVCKAYMDAMDVDIELKLYVQAKKGATTYAEVDKIPSTSFYSLNTNKSACTGTSTMTLKNQKVIISATNRTNCVAYLDVTSGPILESMKVTNSGTSTIITLGNSNLGTIPSTYYYSSDGGKSYVTSTNNTYTFTSQADPSYAYKAYSSDASGNTSRVFETSTYGYYGLVDYSNQIQTKTITESGYYKLETWGAQGGTNGSYVGGYGGYSIGYMYLDSNSTLYLAIGGMGGSTASVTNVGGYNGGGYSGNNSGAQSYGGGGASHISSIAGTIASIGADNIDKIIMIAGGGGGATSGSTTQGGCGGGYIGCSGTASTDKWNTSTYLPIGASQTGPGYAYQNATRQGSFGTGLTANSTGWGGGGGGGLYGGSNGHGTTGSGGSGYIGNSLLLNKSMYCFGCATSSVESTKTLSTTCHNSNATESCSKEGNGYAIITYVGQTLE